MVRGKVQNMSTNNSSQNDVFRNGKCSHMHRHMFELVTVPRLTSEDVLFLQLLIWLDSYDFCHPLFVICAHVGCVRVVALLHVLTARPVISVSLPLRTNLRSSPKVSSPLAHQPSQTLDSERQLPTRGTKEEFHKNLQVLTFIRLHLWTSKLVKTMLLDVEQFTL